MNEQPILDKTKDSFKVVVIICLVVLASAVGWLVYKTENIAKDKTTTPTSETKDAGKSSKAISYTEVKSGGGGFHISLPDGWGPLIRDQKSDFVIIPGMIQPTIAAGAGVKINDVEGYGSDSASVFTAMLVNKGSAASARGEASEFVIGKGEDSITGKKYVYTYTKDDLVGIGTQRFQGDRDYEYVFPFEDKEFHVYYNVYGSDPRNLSVTVDEIVRTALLAKVTQADL